MKDEAGVRGAHRLIPGQALALAVLTGAVILSFCGCFFEPRTPEQPGSGEIAYNPRSNAGNVLNNIELAVNGKDSGGYDDAISETFSYEPDDQTLQSFPGVDWAGWGKQQEQEFADRLFQNVTSMHLDLRDSTINDEPPSGIEADWEMIYFLKVNDSTGETRYRGRAELTFRLIGSYWFLDKWVDVGQESDPDTGANLPTMGSLRGAFASK